MSEVCPLCGEPFRGILNEPDFKAYLRTNSRMALCKFDVGDAAFWAIHTDPADEWLTPPEYVMGRTLESLNGAKSVPPGDADE